MIRLIHVRRDDKYDRQHERGGEYWNFRSVELRPDEFDGAFDGGFRGSNFSLALCFLLILLLVLLLLLKSEDLVAVASKVACSPLLLICVGVAPLMVA